MSFSNFVLYIWLNKNPQEVVSPRFPMAFCQKVKKREIFKLRICWFVEKQKNKRALLKSRYNWF